MFEWLIVYLVVGVVILELTIKFDKRPDSKVNQKQIINTVLLWPIILAIAIPVMIAKYWRK